MASNQTSNFQLSQWEANDEVLRADFNEDNLKIETALTAVKAVTDKAYTTDSAPVVFGWYQGDGAAQRKIEVGFTPKAVFLCSQTGHINTNSAYGGLAIQGHAMARHDNDDFAQWAEGETPLAICDGGFYVGFHLDEGVRTNQQRINYLYQAFR